MLSIKIICIGKMKEKFLVSAISEFEKRLKTMCKFEIIELSEHRVSDNPSQSEIEICKTREGESILKKISDRDFLISMCIEGNEISSEKFAEKIMTISNSGISTITFVIGGSFGISDTVKSKSNFKMSVSPMTFPHQLFRVMLTEQIYRALSINLKTKYHK